MEVNELRNKYPVFEYKSFSCVVVDGGLKINFFFEVKPDISFSPEIFIPNVSEELVSKFGEEKLNNLVFHLGLIEIPSCWKATCSPKIMISAGYLSDEQIVWWKDLFIKGMGQYYYENKINYKENNFLEIISESKVNHTAKVEVAGDDVLIPIGGGKDSAVTLSLLTQNIDSVSSLVIDPASPSAYEISDMTNVTNRLILRRKIDTKLIELNKDGFLNGHTPYSAMLFFNSVLVASLHGIKYVAFSNERSSNEGNTDYLGDVVNHQYSKTFEFENKFDDYNEKYLSNVKLFSFVRPLYDIQIAKMFSEMEEYFSVVRSCNVGQKLGTWCGNCPKCLSTFILFYPFLGKEKTIEIFGKNLYEDAELKDVLVSLIDERSVKPFECVGTRMELKCALYLSTKNEWEELPILLLTAKEYLSEDINWDEQATNLLTSWNEENNVSSEYVSLLKKYVNK